MSIGIKGWIDDDNRICLWCYQRADAHGVISRHYRRWQAEIAKRLDGQGGHIKKILVSFDLDSAVKLDEREYWRDQEPEQSQARGGQPCPSNAAPQDRLKGE